VASTIDELTGEKKRGMRTFVSKLKEASTWRVDRVLAKSLFGAAMLAALAACASSAPEGGAARGSPTPTPSSTNEASARPPVEAATERVRRTGAGKFNQYKFTYERTDREVTALFTPKLPWSDSSVVGAAREVIAASYEERSENFPRPVNWKHDGAAASAIKLEGNKYEYVFLPLKEEAGEVRKILFWQLPKGTTR
jgi:hypothetical protein